MEAWAASNGAVFADVSGSANPTPTTDAGLQLLEGTPPIYSIDYATMAVNEVAPAGSPQSGSHIGALWQSMPDWTSGWTYGIHEGSRGQPLWFE